MGTTDRFTPGHRIGDYVVEREAPDGNGYEAVHVLLPRRVRLEVMHPTFVGLKPVAVRMMREACILEALHHPGVPRIFEVGMMSDHRTTRPWVASELVDGDCLADSLSATGTLAPMEVLALIRDLAEVLAHTHARGVVHRALRTDSVIRSGYGGDDPASRGFPICIVEWSEARIDASDRARADDVFALGVIAYQALTGHLPNMPAARRCPTAPARLCLMIDDLLVANPMSRPSAAEVRARAKLILETIHEDETALEYEPQPIELVELDADVTPDEPIAPPQAGLLRTRWTPPLGVTAAPAEAPAGIAIGILKPRS